MEHDALAAVLSQWANRLAARCRDGLSTYDLRALYDAASRAAQQGSERPLRRWEQELSPSARASLSTFDIDSLVTSVMPGDQPVLAQSRDLAPTGLGPPARPDHARIGGYTGDTCNVCGGAALVRSGRCVTCQDCGSTTGCG